MGNVVDKFNTLKRYCAKVENRPFIPNNTSFATGDFFPFTFNNEYILLITKHPDDYEQMDVICDYFQEEMRLKSKRKDQEISPLDWWYSNRNMELLQYLFKGKQSFDSFNMREGIYHLVKECTQFKPTVALSLFQLLHAKRVLDFCAGWGDRLIAAIAADLEFYCGVDPNMELAKGHQEIIETLCTSDNRKDRFKIVYAPFQSAVIPSESQFDLVFTSPPFFDFEIYTQLPGQSVSDHPQLYDWMVSFLFCSIEKSWNLLAYDGHLAIHIVDVYKTRVVEAMNLFIQVKTLNCFSCIESVLQLQKSKMLTLYCFAQAKLPGSKYCGVIGSIGHSAKILPIWVWKKCHTTDSSRVTMAQQYFSKYFDELHLRVEQDGGKTMKRPR